MSARPFLPRLRLFLQFAAVALLLLVRAAVPDVIAQAAPSPDQDLRTEYRRPATPFPDTDPYSATKAKLGQLLFFDPILSGSGKIACASCHNPSYSFTDGLRHGVGEHEMATHTPTLLNVAWAPILGWDGHFPSLEKVAFGPILNPEIMGGNEKEIIARLTAIPEYRAAFTAAFPDGVVSRTNIEDALATFERTLVSGPAPFDRWVDGDESAISAAAKRGFALFNGKAGCAECHAGWAFTDEGFYDVGVGKGQDIGRGKLFANSPKLQYAFKTPTLRNVAVRAPYMHDGSEATLAAVIDLYNRGGVDRPSRADPIKPLGLNAQEEADLIAFLKTLTSDQPIALDIPILPREATAQLPEASSSDESRIAP